MNVVDSLDFSVLTSQKDVLNESKFIPVECDFRMRLHNWFYSDKDENTIKSLDELMGLYYYSVGRGANLLINIGPDRRGLLPQKDADRLIEFGNEVKRRFSSPISTKFTKEDSRYTIEFDEPTLINHLIIKEEMQNSQNVKKFIINAFPLIFGKEITVYEGYTIGHKAICMFPTFLTNKIQLIIEESVAAETITDIATYYVKL